MQTHWKLEATLRRFHKTPLALARASGLTKTTVYNIVNSKAQAVEIETLDKLVAGLEKLTGQPMSITDVIEREPKRNALLEEALKNAQPFDWEQVQLLIPAWTPEERQKNLQDLEDDAVRREQERENAKRRDAELLALFSGGRKRKQG